MLLNLKNKVALVTGASRGIGKAIAVKIAKSGADVIVNYNKMGDTAEQVSTEIRSLGRRSVAIQADVSDSSEVERMAQSLDEHFGGQIDILVNNAGITQWKGLNNEVVSMTDQEWCRVLDINLKGAFLVSRAVASKMIKRGNGGRIIAIASGAAHSGRAGYAHYCASKAGLLVFCKALAIELAPYNITVNTVSPGYVDIGRFDSVATKGLREDRLKRVLLRRPGSPEDIANVVAFLASEEANWITGADFRADGGESAGRVPAAFT